MEDIRKLWNEACLSAEIPAISMDTCARIMAVIYSHGNNEAFVYNKSFLADVEYIQNRFHIKGGEIPSSDFAILLKQYVDELETYEQDHKDDQTEGSAVFHPHVPQWAIDLFKDRYDTTLI